MKSIYYFLEWHWKKYKFDSIHLIPISLTLIVISFVLGFLGYKVIGGLIILGTAILIIVGVIELMIVRPIRMSYREFKDEQRNLLDKINYGERDYERFRRR